MVCCDTTFLSDLFRKNSAALRKLRELRDNNEPISTTIITIAELYYGAFKSRSVEEEKGKVRQVVEKFLVFYLDTDASERYGEIRNYVEQRGQPIGDRDIFVVAISLSNGENTIITRDREHFERIPGINVITY